MLTDIQIAQANEIKHIAEVAKELGINEEELNLYGKNKAKIPQGTLNKIKDNKRGKLVLVTAISPTPAGEGKSTVTVGLGDALRQIGKNSTIAIREPSLGPVMGVKGGAAGGGYAQVVPMEDINLHFTGDMHAITSANNALSAFIDNHIHQGNELDIDVRRVTWKRVIDMNDRALRQVNVGLGKISNGFPREDGFDITVASEIMAVLCLSKDLDEMRERFGRMVFGQNRSKEPLTVSQLGVEGALTLLMKDAIQPNLVQTLEHTPAFVHGGPFANIAHGCNSVIATDTALKLSDYVITESGFGADLGAEKFMNIKAPVLGKTPDAVVIVATVRSLKMHGGVPVKELNEGANAEAVEKGITNLEKHIENIQSFNIVPVVAINQFANDTDEEMAVIQKACKAKGVKSVISKVFAEGGKGGIDLANAVVEAIDGNDKEFSPLYDAANTTIEEKIDTIVTKLYGGKQVNYSKKAKNQIKEFEASGWGKFPICMAKTQYSLSDDPKELGRPEGFDITIREFVPKVGAGFLVALTGDVMTMPGLPKKPSALNMDVKSDGEIVGLF